MKRTRATADYAPASDYAPQSRSNTNNSALWAIAALAAGLTIGYFCMNKKTPTTNTNIHMQQEVTIQNSQQSNGQYDAVKDKTATPYQPSTQQRPSTPSSQTQPSSQTTPAARQSIDGVVNETISPEEMRAMEQNGGLINEWKGVKQYDDTQVDPNVVNHHYRTRGMTKQNPCDNN
jgi:hypothetical protein